MKQLLMAAILMIANVANASDIVLITKVGATVQPDELKASIEFGLKNAKSKARVIKVEAISPFAHHLLAEVGGIPEISKNSVAFDPFIKYLIPEGDSWIVSIQFQEKSRVLEELTLEFATRSPIEMKLGKPGTPNTYALGSPGNYNLLLNISDSPNRFTMKYRDIGKTSTVITGSWPVLPRFYAIRVTDFDGELTQVLKSLGDEKLMANPLSQITPANEFKLMLGDLNKRGEKVATTPVVQKVGEEIKKPCVNCPDPAVQSSKPRLGIFRR